jgi:hypothetical protein
MAAGMPSLGTPGIQPISPSGSTGEHDDVVEGKALPRVLRAAWTGANVRAAQAGGK